MATTVSYSATMRTRKTTSSSNFKNTAASQEYYENDYNLVGILHFAGMSLVGKVITGIRLNIVSGGAGYGAGRTKTVYVCASNYQSIVSGVTGAGYLGAPLGTFTGSFYNNTTNNTLSGSMLTALAEYFQAGNNTFCIYNPNPTLSNVGSYSSNYLQWSTVTMYVTYEEGVSVPTVSASSVDMGSAVTIFTNRLSTATTHILIYTFGGTSGAIAAGVTTSYAWTPPLTLAQQIPASTSGVCVITCYTYVGDSLTGTASVSVQLNVPVSIAPTISNVSIAEAVSGIAAQFGGYVQNRSRLSVSITASGALGSSISNYRSVICGSTSTGASFTSNYLTASGINTLTFTVTDSRGRTATTTRSISVLAYAPPMLSAFTAERCNSAGTSAQTDGSNVRVNATASVSSVNSRNTMTCRVYYKPSTATAWSLAATLTPASYTVAAANQLLAQTYNVLNSYDFKLSVTDYFGTVEQVVSIGTKQVVMDFFRDGSGIAFGKVAEMSGAVEFGWPIMLDEPLGIAQGGTGTTTAQAACTALGALSKTGGTLTGNLNIQGSLFPSLCLLPTYNDTTNRTVFEGSYAGASSVAAWEDSTGDNRRMLEVRTAAYAPSMDNALLLRTVIAGVYSQYRVFHSGMATPVPVANGGTGASNAKTAMNNLGIFYSAALPSSGVDGQVCLVPVG